MRSSIENLFQTKKLGKTFDKNIEKVYTFDK